MTGRHGANPFNGVAFASCRDIAPDNLDHDVASRCSRPPPTFKSAFDFNHERVLSWLLIWFGDGLDHGLKEAASNEGADHLAKQDL